MQGWRRLIIGALGAVLFVGVTATIVYAVVITPISAGDTIHACVKKGPKGAGKIRIVNADPGTCKDSEFALSWLAVNSVDDLNGTACTIGSSQGTFLATFPAAGGPGVLGCYVQGGEVCDDIDNDGDGAVDDGLGPEICDNGQDDDCDNDVDSADTDCPPSGTCGDGFFNGDESCDDGNLITGDGCSDICQEEPGYSCTGQPSVCAEGGSEVCDHVDNDGDDLIDEDFPTLGETCSRGTGACEANGTLVCAANGEGVECNAPVIQPGSEVCSNSIDDNCDGSVDEGCP